MIACQDRQRSTLVTHYRPAAGYRAACQIRQRNSLVAEDRAACQFRQRNSLVAVLGDQLRDGGVDAHARQRQRHGDEHLAQPALAAREVRARQRLNRHHAHRHHVSVLTPDVMVRATMTWMQGPVVNNSKAYAQGRYFPLSSCCNPHHWLTGCACSARAADRWPHVVLGDRVGNGVCAPFGSCRTWG